MVWALESLGDILRTLAHRSAKNEVRMNFFQTLRDGAISLVPTVTAVVFVILVVSVTGRFP